MTQKNLTIDRLYKEAVLRNDTEFTKSIDELRGTFSKVKNYFRKFDIGYKIKTFRDEKGATAKIRKILQKAVEPKKVVDGRGEIVFKPDKPVSQVQQDMKDAVVKYKDGDSNFKDWQLKRVAVTELGSMRVLAKLMKWADMFGIDQVVEHRMHRDSRTGEDSKAFNGSTFTIKFLMENPQYRVPLRPNDRCDYRLSNKKPRINSEAVVWARKFQKDFKKKPVKIREVKNEKLGRDGN